MVLISHKYHYIYIHIPKTAGQTIKNNMPYDELLDCRFYGILNLDKDCFSNGSFHNKYHLTYKKYLKLYPKRNHNKYRVFTFVRNPYDRLYSTFLFIQQNIKKHSIYINIIVLLFTLIIVIVFLCRSLPLFAISVLLLASVLIWKCYHFANDIVHSNFNTFIADHLVNIRRIIPYAFLPQIEFIRGCTMFYIGREEHFNDNFRELQLRLDIPIIEDIVNHNIITTKKQGNMYKYLKYYTPATIRFVNTYYWEDFEAFGYSMLNPDAYMNI